VIDAGGAQRQGHRRAVEIAELVDVRLHPHPLRGAGREDPLRLVARKGVPLAEDVDEKGDAARREGGAPVPRGGRGICSSITARV